MFQKVISGMLALALLLALLPAGALDFTAWAETEGGFRYTVENGGAWIVGAEGLLSGKVVLPDTLGDYPVVGIGDSAFAECGELTEITLPVTVTTLGQDAFAHCTKLEAVHLPAGLLRIGSYAFLGCESLAAIDIPASVNKLDEGAFAECRGLEEIHLPSVIEVLRS
ncbi:MAG: leucine-rich repeat domain-containing protein, partial [Clostridia bacterium]|nr:leucine-rich repeat domain-containing protein [Clostridia bacterium]